MRAWLLVVLALGACHGGSDGSALTNLGVAGRGLVGDGELQVTLVPELDQGQEDLNGDGDRLDVVLHRFE
jgi:hypothetical protein